MCLNKNLIYLAIGAGMLLSKLNNKIIYLYVINGEIDFLF